MKIIRLCLVLSVLQVLLFLVSWLVTATEPGIPMRSLLSSEGIRWYFGSFTANMAHPLLVWVVLLMVAFSAYRRGGLQHALSSLLRGERLLLRQRTALWLVLFELLLIIVVMVALTCVPHAILLSATGQLFPSSFVSALVPILAFTLFFTSTSFAYATGLLRQFRRPVPNNVLMWLLVYVLAMQLYQSLRFVLDL